MSLVQPPRGRVRPYRIYGDRWRIAGGWEHNDVLYDWAYSVAQLLRGAPDGKPYKIAGAYIEFENNSGAAVSTPSVTRDGAAAYYAALAGHATRDYLRVPVIASTLDSSDPGNFPLGNRLLFYIQTEGSVGVHGKPFNDAAQSRVYGGALAAYPAFADPAQDVLFSRFYYTNPVNQLIKLAGSQLGMTWELTLG